MVVRSKRCAARDILFLELSQTPATRKCQKFSDPDKAGDTWIASIAISLLGRAPFSSCCSHVSSRLLFHGCRLFLYLHSLGLSHSTYLMLSSLWPRSSDNKDPMCRPSAGVCKVRHAPSISEKRWPFGSTLTEVSKGNVWFCSTSTTIPFIANSLPLRRDSVSHLKPSRLRSSFVDGSQGHCSVLYTDKILPDLYPSSHRSIMRQVV
ncbi:hypothetical protein BDY19DRAFT_258774 [Irpex rosettiformis]|uniref:Uncharacterized protein n=1 Tax=Irpex rosettiformis TaxID=378272 RepID=A0ACB8UHN8_9APHY|nr:hypothetical protein BDY19DRAFT_258774 [Irpex rosettiformis]